MRGLCCKLFVAASAGYFRRKKKKGSCQFCRESCLLSWPWVGFGFIMYIIVLRWTMEVLSPTDYDRYLIMYLVLLLIDCFSTVFLVIFFDFILWSCKIVTVCYYTDLEVLIEGLMQTTSLAFVKMLVFEYSEFESFVARCDSCSRQFLLC